MVFVHARNATGRIATILRDMAKSRGNQLLFLPENNAQYGLAQKQVSI